MQPLSTLVHVVNNLGPGAIPNILQNLQREFRRYYKTTIVALEPIAAWDDGLRRLEANGAEITSLECSRWNVPQQFWRLRRFLHDRRPDIAHAHLGRAEVLTPLVAPATTYSVATYHTTPDGHHGVTRLLMKYSNRRLGIRTFVSHSVAKAWQGSDYEPGQVIYNPVDADAFAGGTKDRSAIRAALGADAATPLLLTTGRLIPAKGHADLLEAIALLRRRGLEKIIVAIAGDGEMRASLMQLSDSLGIASQVRFLGFRSDVAQLLGAADLFIFPSHREGLGLAPIEAMASGTPVIISDYPAGREFLEDGETGLVFPIGDRSALADAIELYVRNPAKFEPMTARACLMVDEKFDSRKIALAYKALYDARCPHVV